MTHGLRTPRERWQHVAHARLSGRILRAPEAFRWVAAVGLAVAFYQAFGDRCPAFINLDDE